LLKTLQLFEFKNFHLITIISFTIMSTASNQLNLPLSFNQLFELVKQLPNEQKKKLIKVLQKENSNNDVIPMEHKNMVRERIKNSKATELLDWDDVKKDFDGI
jgi:hypothetical protein